MDEFAETVPMETFSIGIALLKFIHNDFEDPSIPILIRVWASEGTINETGNMHEIVHAIFKFFAEFFSLARYPFNKLDVVVFSENKITSIDDYGLIFIRYTPTKQIIQGLIFKCSVTHSFETNNSH